MERLKEALSQSCHYQDLGLSAHVQESGKVF